MHWGDHIPPHFHAGYQGEEVMIEIETGNVVGTIKQRALGLIQEWRRLHQAELMENWKLAQQKRILKSIEPLE
jgi:hypothetical protein